LNEECSEDFTDDSWTDAVDFLVADMEDFTEISFVKETRSIEEDRFSVTADFSERGDVDGIESVTMMVEKVVFVDFSLETQWVVESAFADSEACLEGELA